MKKAKKAILITLIVMVTLAILLFVAYEIAMRIMTDKAVKTVVKSEINNMLDAGEITIDEVKEIAEMGIESKEEKDTVETIVTETPDEKVPTTDANPQDKPAPKKEVSSAEREVIVDKAAEKVASGITAEERREIIELIRKNLTAEDMKYLLGMLKDGITTKEVRLAAELGRSRFEGEDFYRVRTLWHKYHHAIPREKKK